MTLYKLLTLAKKKPKKEASLWAMAEYFEIYDSISNPEKSRLEEVWISYWNCTDTIVGEKAYFLDDLLVAYSSQPARKASEDIFWVSKDAYNRVKTYIESLVEKEEDRIPVLTNSMLSQDHLDQYQVEYVDQLLSSHEYFHKGVPVTYIPKDSIRSYDSTAVFMKNGIEALIPLEEITISYF